MLQKRFWFQKHPWLSGIIVSILAGIILLYLQPFFKIPKLSIIKSNYYFLKDIHAGEALVDPLTGTSISVIMIHETVTADILLTLPNKKFELYEYIIPGYTWTFTHKNKKYMLTILKIDKSKLKYEIREIIDSN